jgi:hypothetical protein
MIEFSLFLFLCVLCIGTMPMSVAMQPPAFRSDERGRAAVEGAATSVQCCTDQCQGKLAHSDRDGALQEIAKPHKFVLALPF